MIAQTQSITETKTPTQTPALFSLKATWDQKIGKLHEIFSHVAKFVDVVTLQITSKTIQFKAMDASHVGMINGLLDYSDFSGYHYDSTEQSHEKDRIGFPVQINLKDFCMILKNFNKLTDRIELHIDTSNPHISVKCNGTEMKLKALSKEDDDEPPTPDLIFQVSMDLNTKDIRETINIPLNLHAAYVEFMDGPVKAFQVSAETSDDIGFNRTLDQASYNITPTKTIKALYSLEFLDSIIPKNQYLVKLFKTCNLQFSDEMPVQLTFPLSDSSRLLYFLAPRVEEEDKEEEAVKQRNAETEKDIEEAEAESKALEEEDDECDMPSPQDNYKAGIEAEKKEKAPAPLPEKVEAEVQAICKLGGEIITEENYVPSSEIQNPEFEDDEDSEEDGPELPKVNCVRCGAALDGEEVEQKMKICGGCIELTIKEHREKDEPYCYYCGAVMTKEEVAKRGHNTCQQCHDSDREEPIFKPVPAEPKKVVVYSYSSYDAQKKIEENKKAADPIPFTTASKAEAKAPKPTYSQFAGKYLAAHPKTPLPEVATLWRAL